MLEEWNGIMVGVEKGEGRGMSYSFWFVLPEFVTFDGEPIESKKKEKVSYSAVIQICSVSISLWRSALNHISCTTVSSTTNTRPESARAGIAFYRGFVGRWEGWLRWNSVTENRRHIMDWKDVRSRWFLKTGSLSNSLDKFAAWFAE